MYTSIEGRRGVGWGRLHEGGPYRAWWALLLLLTHMWLIHEWVTHPGRWLTHAGPHDLWTLLSTQLQVDCAGEVTGKLP